MLPNRWNNKESSLNQDHDAQKETGIKGVFFDNPGLEQKAQRLAEQLRVPCSSRAHLPENLSHWAVWLLVEADGLFLAPMGKNAPGPVTLNFEEPSRLKRFQNVQHERNQPLAKAIGVQKGHLSVLDATAGLGIDSQMMLGWGLKVTAVERSPVLGFLWDQALKRIESPQLQQTFENLKFYKQDALSFLQDSKKIWDVIYLDPMYPERKKGLTGVKKEMQIFRKIVGADLDTAAVLEASILKAKKRVVVKRPKHAPVLNNRAPSYQIKGTVVRFDIYLV